MAFDLSFSEEFFLAEGEPYDRSTLALNSKGLPLSVWSAIEKMRLEEPQTWADMAEQVFGLLQPDLLTSETVLDKIRETNTCGTLSAPVDVWIDSKGDFTIEVFDGEEREETDNKL